MMAPPAVSIVMPCFNASSTMAASIGSIVGQSFTMWELIAVDDGSTDATAEILASYDDPRIRVLSQANNGVSAARNRGLTEVNSPFVAFLDSDDTWEPKFLETMLAALADRPDAVLAYCGWQNTGLAPERCRPYLPPDYDAAAENRFDLLMRGCPWPIHAALARTAAVKATGGFDQRLTVAEDYLLWLDLATRGRLVRVSQVLARYHHDAFRLQATANVVRAVRQTREALHIFLARNPAVDEALGTRRRRALILEPARDRAYAALWSRDLATAQPLFRDLLKAGYLRKRDLRYALPALLPAPLYHALVLHGHPGAT